MLRFVHRVAVCAALPACCSGVEERVHDSGVEERVHDPSRLFVRDGDLVVLGSGAEGAALRQVRVDLEAGTASPVSTVSADTLAGSWWREAQPWNPTGEFDAPSVTASGDRVYFTVFDEGEDGVQDAIGLAEWDGQGWQERGIVVSSQGEAADTPRAMDPAVVDADSGQYLVFGSHAGGIYVTELDPETGLLLDDPDTPSTAEAPDRFTRLADNPAAEDADDYGIEAATIYPHDGRFTLFVNVGRCCLGSDSTYAIRVGQADAITGPYLDRDGQPMLEGGGTPFLGDEGHLVGPGHAGVTTVDGEEVLTVHIYDGDSGGTSDLVARRLTWDAEGWPVAGAVLVGP